MEIKRLGKLYTLKAEAANQALADIVNEDNSHTTGESMIVNYETEVELWYARLGHVSPQIAKV